MASGPWSQLYGNAAGHPKVAKLAYHLGVPRREAFGCLTTLWCWATNYAPDGVLDEHTIADIEIAADWPGTPGAFIEAMLRVHLMDRRDDETLELHDRMDCAGSYKEALKKQTRRAARRAAEDAQAALGLESNLKQKKLSPDRVGTNRTLSPDKPPFVPGPRAGARSERRGEIEQEHPPTPHEPVIRRAQGGADGDEPLFPDMSTFAPTLPLEDAQGTLTAADVGRIIAPKLCLLDGAMASWARSTLAGLGRETVTADELRVAYAATIRITGECDLSMPIAQLDERRKRLRGMLATKLRDPGPPPAPERQPMAASGDAWAAFHAAGEAKPA